MRFEVWAAYATGIVLPAVELFRRAGSSSPFASYADDSIAGGLLLWAAISCTRRRRAGPVLLIVAWALVCGGFYFSIVGQVQDSSRADVSGISNLTVILIKAGLCAVAIISLVASSKRVVGLLK